MWRQPTRTNRTSLVALPAAITTPIISSSWSTTEWLMRVVWRVGFLLSVLFLVVIDYLQKLQSRITAHHRSHESGKFQFPCDLCPNKYPDRISCRFHNRHFHQRSSHSCSFCDFSSRTGLMLDQTILYKHDPNYMNLTNVSGEAQTKSKSLSKRKPRRLPNSREWFISKVAPQFQHFQIFVAGFSPIEQSTRRSCENNRSEYDLSLAKMYSRIYYRTIEYVFAEFARYLYKGFKWPKDLHLCHAVRFSTAKWSRALAAEHGGYMGTRTHHKNTWWVQ